MSQLSYPETTVFRVEHRSLRNRGERNFFFGPYVGGLASNDPELQAGFDAIRAHCGSVVHPEWAKVTWRTEDGTRGYNDPQWHLAGFASWEELTDWFDDKLLTDLASAGFVARTYRVPAQHVLYAEPFDDQYTHRQLVFDFRHAVEHGVRGLSELALTR